MPSPDVIISPALDQVRPSFAPPPQVRWGPFFPAALPTYPRNPLDWLGPLSTNGDCASLPASRGSHTVRVVLRTALLVRPWQQPYWIAMKTTRRRMPHPHLRALSKELRRMD